MSGGEVVTAAGKPIVTAAAKPAASWLRRKLRPDISESALDAATAQLAADVARIERTRLDQLQVSPGTGIPLQFSDLAAVETVGSDALVRGTLPEVAPYYQGLSAPRRLLVVGEPGSGKTVLILHLILDLLRLRQTATDPVPVRVNATSWDGRTNLTELLVEKLNDQYALHKRTARALIDRDRILPVIDGLDEMDAATAEPHRAKAAVARFNEPPWRSRPLVVTCRSKVYEVIRSARDGAGIFQCETVSMRPLSSDEIAEHVQTLLDDGGRISQSYGQRLAPLLDELAAQPAGILARTLETPWMFTLAMAYFERADDGAVASLLAARTSARIADLLFDAQIPIACGHQPGESSTWSYPESNVQHWMRVLAHHLSTNPVRGTGRTEVALHQIWLLAGERRTSFLHGSILALIFGPIGALVSALGYGSWGVLGALAGGLVGAVLGGLTTVTPERVVLRTHRKGALRARLRGTLVHVLVGSLGAGLIGGLTIGLAAGLTAGLTYGALVGLAFGLTAVPPRFHPPREVKREVHDDFVAGLVFGTVFGLAIGLSVALTIGLTTESADRLKDYFAFGLIAGLSVGQVFGLAFATAACRYACATLVFRRTGIFAPRPVRFLEWSVAAGLIRITGTAYQFRHETYREWLMSHPAPVTETRSVS